MVEKCPSKSDLVKWKCKKDGLISNKTENSFAGTLWSFVLCDFCPIILIFVSNLIVGTINGLTRRLMLMHGI